MASLFSRCGLLCVFAFLIGCSKAPVPDQPSEAARRLAQFSPTSHQDRSDSSPPRDVILEEIQPRNTLPPVETPAPEIDLEKWVLPAPTERTVSRPSPRHQMQLSLRPGRDLDIMHTFRFDRYAVEDAFEEQGRVRNVHWRNVELKYSSGEPFLVFGRRGAKFHGAALAFYENGNPMTYVTYKSGQRHGRLMTWDELRQPVYFAQYKNGKKDGFSCFYKKCSSECSDSHLLLVQEWDRGETWESHLVSDDQVAMSVKHTDRELVGNLPELTAAIEVMDIFEAGIDETEGQVQDWLLSIQRQIAQRIKMERRQRIIRASRERRRRGLAMAGRGGGGGMRFGGS